LEARMASNAATPTENVLYVILHGLISLVEMANNGFDAYMIEMGPDHRYLYGSWLLEKEIPQRNEDIGQDPVVFTLDSVDAAARTAENTLNPDLNLIIDLNKTIGPNKRLPPNLPRVRAVVHLPRPRNIYYFICGKVIQGSITGKDKDKLVKQPTEMSGVRVFEYTFANGVKPQLLGGNPVTKTQAWKCPDSLAPVGNRRVATLHLYDEPGVILDPNAAPTHNRDEFSQSSASLGADLQLSKNTGAARPLPLPPLNQPDIHALGVLPEEIAPLGNRELDLLAFQFGKRTNGQVLPEKAAAIGGGGGPICGGGNALAM
jgi:hypothetical protein